jgi:arylsulfatase A-like enzyme
MKTILILLTIILFVCEQAFADTAKKPNIVLILADDLGYGDVGCFGAQDIRTPHLDKMAAEGLRLSSFYAQPICGPSRAALMTGCYPIRIGEVANGKNGHTLPHPKEVTMAEMLRDSGYRTGIVGKWHLGMSQGCDPLSQGFEKAYFTPAFNGTSRDIQPNASIPFLSKPGEVVRTIKTQADMDTLTADCTREALEFMRNSKQKPFFLYLAYHMPHVPLGASAAFRGKSHRGLYGDAIEELDDAIGQVLAELKQLSIDENTLVVFTSDNGPWISPQIGNHGGSAGVFRGGKMETWEGGWRVPGIIRWPGKVRSGEVSDDIVCTLDLMPTFATFAQARPTETNIDGLDIADFLTKSGASSPRDTFLYYNGTRLCAVRHKEWKLVFARPARGDMPYMPNWLTGHIKPLLETQLFNLLTEPAESKNLSADHPAIVKQLTDLAEQTRATLGDFTGPGKEARFFEPGEHWPAVITSSDNPEKKSNGIPKAKHNP